MRRRVYMAAALLLASASCGGAAGDDPFSEEPGPFADSSEYGEAALYGGLNCGLRALMVLRELLGYTGVHEDLRASAAADAGAPELTVADLVRLADAVGLRLKPMEGALEDLDGLTVPAIVHLRTEHFVVLEYCRRSGVVLVETTGAVPHVAVARREDFAADFSGVVLVPELGPTAAEPCAEPGEVPLIRGIAIGNPGETEIAMHNSGAGELECEVVGGSCSCLSVRPTSVRIPGGATAAWTVMVGPTSVRTEPTPMVLTVRTNAPSRPLLHLGLFAQADAGGWASRARVARMEAGKELILRIAYTLNHEAEPIEVGVAEPWASAVFEPRGDPAPGTARGYYALTVGPEAPIGLHAVEIVGAFRSERTPVLRTAAFVDVVAPAIAAPSVLAIDPGVTRESVLRWDPEEVVSDLTVSTENLDGCEVTYERTGDGEGKVTIVPPAEAPQEVTTGWVRLTGTLASGLERVVGEVKVHLLPVDPFAVM